VQRLIGTEKCKSYGTSSKPVGLLQDFADADQLKIRFGLMTAHTASANPAASFQNVARFNR